MTNKSTHHLMTTEGLREAMRSEDWLVRSGAIERYSKQKPSIDAIPILRRALTDCHHSTVKYAARSLRKLGPLAIDVMDDLFMAAVLIDTGTKLPQAYPDCVEAMASIQPTHPQLLPLIGKHALKYCNWVPIASSLRALGVIGTPEAKAMIQETAEFWWPKLNKTQRGVIERMLARIDDE